MNDTAKLEMSAIAAALTLGILGDALLRSFPWGVNFALWACALAAAIVFLGRSRREAFAEGEYWLLLPIALFSLAFLWHDSTALDALNLLALLTALSLLMLRCQGRRLQVSSMMQYALGGIVAGFNAAFGMFPLALGNREWRTSVGGGHFRGGVAVLCGLAFSLPPLLIFGSLFMGADAVFRSLFADFLRTIPKHFLVFAIIAFWVGGYLRGLLFGKEMNWVPGEFASPFSLGAVEMVIMLGLLDTLFLAFVVVQIRYFFGGAALVHATTGLTYAEYARSGFFQLLAVAALLLPFLLLVHWLLPHENAKAQSWFRGLAGVQIVLLFIIMASAFQRMRLYQEEYGLSEQRLYPTAFMGWLAVVFVWFALTVLRGRRERFAFGAMVAGFLLIAVLHVLNPDALIARTNLARARAGRPFDATYAVSLSADAVPELVSGASALNPRDRGALAKYLLNWTPSQNPDWRSWNLARTRARRALQEKAPALHAMAISGPKN
jgi:hypothetical protein